MTTTTNYQLPVWSKSDRIRMADFNGMTDKLDTALAAQAAAIAACGNCKVEYGTYIGNGQTSRTHTFSKKPLLVCIQLNGDYVSAFFLRGCTRGPVLSGFSYTVSTAKVLAAGAAWNGSKLTLSTLSGNQSVGDIMNTSGLTYNYLALLATDEA